MKISKFRKGFAISLFALALTASSTSDAFAAGSKQCDNDPATSGCTSSYQGSWTKVNSPTSVSSDIRYELGIDYQSGDYYEWLMVSGQSSTSMSYSVFLNSALATATVSYYLDYSYFATLNQDTAPAGWSTLGSKTNFGNQRMRVYTSQSDTTVADAFKVSW